MDMNSDKGKSEEDEIKRYLKSALVTTVRDILFILATGIGIERLFNSTRDIYHYRRGSLKPISI
ncbi:uncharacterized protein N7496_005714 [Penicillium cataractarum]|uniref:Uncharacterized protein n=1 Tax=Penicillium cataractarum TaxID=2100454 RepID=A0A9W9SH64_9EURO|nr:uncharacterized protein N7496_005714 [Penicillium cataractarum]KAJ5378305.1 hypothetical protein N7496_005714 [Penicillium cataractarum]